MQIINLISDHLIFLGNVGIGGYLRVASFERQTLYNACSFFRYFFWRVNCTCQTCISYHILDMNNIPLEGFLYCPGPNLDKSNIRLLNPAHFYENYTKLCFYSKHSKVGSNRCWWNLRCPFCLFLKESVLFGQYRTLPYFSRLGLVEIHKKFKSDHYVF